MALLTSTPRSEIEKPLSFLVAKLQDLLIRAPLRPVILLGYDHLFDTGIYVGIDSLQVVPDNSGDVVRPKDTSLIDASCHGLLELDKPLRLGCIRTELSQEDIEHHVLVNMLNPVQVLLCQLPGVGWKATLIEPFPLMLFPSGMDNSVAEILYRQVVIEYFPIHRDTSLMESFIESGNPLAIT